SRRRTRDVFVSAWPQRGELKSAEPKPIVLSARSNESITNLAARPSAVRSSLNSGCSFVSQLLWRGNAAVVGSVIIVAVWTTDRSGSAVIAGGIISTRGGSADRGGTDSGSTDADRHSRAYTTVVATTVNAAAVDATARDTSAICGGVS